MDADTAKLCAQLLAMGFSEELSRAGVVATNSKGVPQALDWIMQHDAPDSGSSAANLTLLTRRASEEQDGLRFSLNSIFPVHPKPSISQEQACPQQAGSAKSGDVRPPLPEAIAMSAHIATVEAKILEQLTYTAPSATIIAKAALILRRRAAEARTHVDAEYQVQPENAERRRSRTPAVPAAPRSKEKLHLPAYETDIIAGKKLLAERLSALGLRALVVTGDGNCQFRALSHNLYGSDAHHLAVRHAIVDHMRLQAGFFSVMFAEGEFEPYLALMSSERTWGDEITLRAASECFGCAVHVLTSHGQHWYLKYHPHSDAGQELEPTKHLFLEYVAPIHYDAFTLKAPVTAAATARTTAATSAAATLSQRERF